MTKRDKPTPLETLGARLKEVRVQRGMTQTEVAEALDVAKQTISQWEGAKAPPMITNLIKFSVVMQVDIADLLKELSDDLGPGDNLRRRLSAVSNLVPFFGSESAAGRIMIEGLTQDERRERAQKFVPTTSKHDPHSDLAFPITNRANEPRYKIGDTVTIREGVAEPGQMVLACVGGEFYFRQFVPISAASTDGARLTARNPLFHEIIMGPGDVVLGVMGEHTTTFYD